MGREEEALGDCPAVVLDPVYTEEDPAALIEAPMASSSKAPQPFIPEFGVSLASGPHYWSSNLERLSLLGTFVFGAVTLQAPRVSYPQKMYSFPRLRNSGCGMESVEFWMDVCLHCEYA